MTTLSLTEGTEKFALHYGRPNVRFHWELRRFPVVSAIKTTYFSFRSWLVN